MRFGEVILLNIYLKYFKLRSLICVLESGHYDQIKVKKHVKKNDFNT